MMMYGQTTAVSLVPDCLDTQVRSFTKHDLGSRKQVVLISGMSEQMHLQLLTLLHQLLQL